MLLIVCYRLVRQLRSCGRRVGILRDEGSGWGEGIEWLHHDLTFHVFKENYTCSALCACFNLPQ